jgi:hypothetical protein
MGNAILGGGRIDQARYTVSFTQGNNTPVADLMVGSPSSKLFWVDVKGLSAKNSWMITPKEPRDDLFMSWSFVPFGRKTKKTACGSLFHFDAA